VFIVEERSFSAVLAALGIALVLGVGSHLFSDSQPASGDRSAAPVSTQSAGTQPRR
jgi:hypothetical protein